VIKECGVLTINTALQALVHTVSSFTTGTDNYTSQKDLATWMKTIVFAYVTPRLSKPHN
jgi:endoglucanase Acf2